MAEYTPYPVQVITPEGTAFTGEAQIVVVPGDAGQLGDPGQPCAVGLEPEAG